MKTLKYSHTYIQVLRGLYCIVILSYSTLNCSHWTCIKPACKDTRDEFTVEKNKQKKNLLSSKKYLSVLALILFIIKYILWVTNSVSKLPIKKPIHIEGAGRVQRHKSLLLPPICRNTALYSHCYTEDIICVGVKPHAVWLVSLSRMRTNFQVIL